MRIFCSFYPMRSRAWRFLAVFLLALAVFAIGGLTESLFSPDIAVSAKTHTVQKKQSGKTKEERQNFISSLGWETDPGSEESGEVVIPKKFDEIYERYNELQLSQGLDLKRYRGKSCERYTYRVLNFPDAADMEVRLNLLVYKGKIIGGDVCSLGLDGFQQTLIFPVGESLEEKGSALMSL